MKFIGIFTWCQVTVAQFVGLITERVLQQQRDVLISLCKQMRPTPRQQQGNNNNKLGNADEKKTQWNLEEKVGDASAPQKCLWLRKNKAAKCHKQCNRRKVGKSPHTDRAKERGDERVRERDRQRVGRQPKIYFWLKCNFVCASN